MLRSAATILIVLVCATIVAAEEHSAEEQQIIDAIERLSAATAPGGGGPDAYAEVLASDFTRWTMGEGEIQDRDAWVDGMRGWWEDGWRVTARETDYLEIAVLGEFATMRRIVTESYRGPEDEESRSRTALAETWVRRAGEWRLLRVNARPLEL